jgi:hypothetical protein
VSSDWLTERENKMEDLVRSARIQAILTKMDVLWEDIQLYRRIGDTESEQRSCEDLLLAQQRLAEATRQED